MLISLKYIESGKYWEKEKKNQYQCTANFTFSCRANISNSPMRHLFRFHCKVTGNGECCYILATSSKDEQFVLHLKRMFKINRKSVAWKSEEWSISLWENCDPLGTLSSLHLFDASPLQYKFLIIMFPENIIILVPNKTYFHALINQRKKISLRLFFKL